MPRVTIHIRNEDWEKWNAIPSVPEWLHTHLNEDSAMPHLLSTVNTSMHETREGQAIQETRYEDMEETA